MWYQRPPAGDGAKAKWVRGNYEACCFVDRCLDRHVDTLALDTQESLLPISVVPDRLALVVCFLSLSSLFDASLSRSPHLSAHPYWL